jgi:hypothetical protein
LKYVPLNKTAFQRHALLQEWISGALLGEHWDGLSVEGWFKSSQTDGRFIWAPAPQPLQTSPLKDYARLDTLVYGVATYLFALPS